MTPDEFKNAIDLLWPGHGGQERATLHFGWSGSRTIRKYISGERAVPAWLAGEVADLLTRFPGGISEVSPTKTIAILQAHMTAAGWSATQAAASILGAALRNARTQMDPDAMIALLAEAPSDRSR